MRSAAAALQPRQRALAPRRRLGQREREREDASATLTRPITSPIKGARTLQHVIPKRNHAKNNPLSKNEQVPLPRSPSKQCCVDHEDRPKPNLMSAPPPTRMTRAGRNIPSAIPPVKSPLWTEIAMHGPADIHRPVADPLQLPPRGGQCGKDRAVPRPATPNRRPTTSATAPRRTSAVAADGATLVGDLPPKGPRRPRRPGEPPGAGGPA